MQQCNNDLFFVVPIKIEMSFPASYGTKEFEKEIFLMMLHKSLDFFYCIWRLQTSTAHFSTNSIFFPV